MGGPHDVAERSGAAETGRGPGRRAADESAGGCGARRGAAVSWRGGCRDAVPGPRPAPAPPGALADARGGRAAPLVLARSGSAARSSRRDAHVGAGDGAVARHRGRLRHAARSSTGTARFARGQPGRAGRRGDGHPRRRRAARSSASATTASSPGSGTLVETVRERERRPDAALHPGASTSSRSGGGREPATFFGALPRDHATSAARAGSRRCAGDRGAGAAPEADVRRAPRRCRPRRSSRPLSTARARSRSTTATASGSGTCTCRTSATCPRVLPRPLRRRRRAARARRASTASSCTTRTPTRWRRSSRALNARTDGYGGDASRAASRLPLEVLARRPRAASAPTTCVGHPLPRRRGRSRAAATSTTRSGSACASPRPAPTTCRSRKGGKFEDAKQPKVGEAVYPYTGASGYECMPTVVSDARGPFGRNVPLAARHPRRPSASAGSRDARRHERRRSSTFEQAEGILARGEADIVGGRAPDPRRSRLVPEDPSSATAHRVRRCEFTNYCEGLDQRHKQVTCKLWDRDLDPDDPSVRLASDGRRRLAPPAWRPPAGTDERP